MAIFLKRKRSSEDLSDSSRASSSSSDSSYDATTIPQTWALVPDTDTCMTGTTHQIDNWSMSFAQVKEITPPHLHSRTRKRFRDGRPDESSIYETTYQKLYSAQRSPPGHAPAPIPTSTPRRPSTTSSQKSSPPQTSLHNFWSLPHRPTNLNPSHPSPHLHPYQDQPPNCEDCDTPLFPPTSSPSADDINMTDTEMSGIITSSSIDEQEFACRSCGRQVCAMCAVVEIGRGRECLQCTTSRKRWLGGIGWMSPSQV